MNRAMKMTAAAVALSAIGTTASAVTTVSAGDDIIEQGVISAPDGSAQFDFVAGEDLTIPGFSLAAIGNSGGADINKITVSFMPPNDDSTLLTAEGAIGNTGWGGGTLLGFSVSEGDTWSILFQVADGESLANNIGAHLAFSPVEITAIPLPAGGSLLLAALAVGGVAAYRKKKKAV